MKRFFRLIIVTNFILFSMLFFIAGCSSGDDDYISFRGGTYEGELKDGIPHGEGTAYYESGIKAYEGEFEDGLPHGEGKVYYRSGNLGYVGEIKKDIRHGEGTLYYESGSIWYEGGWKEDKFHGFGIEYFDEGITWGEDDDIDDSIESPYEDETIKYKGEWEEGIKQDDIMEIDYEF